MPYAIALVLDEASAVHAARLTDAVDGSHPAARQGGPPHITLGVYPDDADAAALAESVATLGGGWRRLAVGFSGLGVFPTPGGVLYAAPVVTSALLVRHAQLLSRHAPDPLYASGAWVPHLTLAQELVDGPAMAAALQAAMAAWQPFGATLDRMALFRFHPVEVLALQELQ